MMSSKYQSLNLKSAQMDKLIVKGKDVVLYTETFGSFGSPAIPLVSGAMAPAIFWDEDFCLNLSERFLVIRFDLRDMGFSSHFEPCRPESRTQLQYTIDDMVDDCLESTSIKPRRRSKFSIFSLLVM